MSDFFCVRARGLPWSATEEDVIKFFSDCNVKGGTEGVYLTDDKNGRRSGEVYVKLCSQDDVDKALKHNQQYIGKRYIEVFNSNKNEMEWIVKHSSDKNVEMKESVLRLRGLPFEANEDDVLRFFNGLEIVQNGVGLLLDAEGHTTGEAFVQFASSAVAETARRELHMQKLNHRYIELFASSMMEAKSAISRHIVTNKNNKTKERMLFGAMRGGSRGSANRQHPYAKNAARVGRGGGNGMGIRGGFSKFGNFSSGDGSGPKPLMSINIDEIGSGCNQRYDSEDYSSGFGMGYNNCEMSDIDNQRFCVDDDNDDGNQGFGIGGSFSQGFGTGGAITQGFGMGSAINQGFGIGGSRNQGFGGGVGRNQGFGLGGTGNKKVGIDGKIGIRGGGNTSFGMANKNLAMGGNGNNSIGLGSIGNQGFGMGTVGNKGFSLGSAGNKGFGMGSGGNQGFGMGSAGNQGFGMGNAGNQGFGMRNAGNQGFAMGSSGNQAFGRGGNKSQGFSNNQRFSIGNCVDGGFDVDSDGGFTKGSFDDSGNYDCPASANQISNISGLSVHLRGLPWEAMESDVREFLLPLEPLQVVILQDSNGQSLGEADVLFSSYEEMMEALSYGNGSMVNCRIEITKNSPDEIVGSSNFQSQNNGSSGMSQYAVQLVGLPWSVTQKDIFEFFYPVQPVIVDIHLLANGRASGQADVLFDTFEDRENALKKNRMQMGMRYIEVYAK